MTTTALWPFFRGLPGEPVPEENFWTLWCKGRLTEADSPTIRLGATPSGLTSAHLHHPHFLQAGCPSCCPTNSVHQYLNDTNNYSLITDTDLRECWLLTMCWSLSRWITRDDHSDIDTESGALRISRRRHSAALCFTASSVSLDDNDNSSDTVLHNTYILHCTGNSSLKSHLNTHHTTTVLRPFFGTIRVSRCQKRIFGLYGARED